jgi:hypothetical protein
MSRLRWMRCGQTPRIGEMAELSPADKQNEFKVYAAQLNRHGRDVHPLYPRPDPPTTSMYVRYLVIHMDCMTYKPNSHNSNYVL